MYVFKEFSTPQWFHDHVARVAAHVHFVPTGTTLEVEARKISAAHRTILAECGMCSGRVDGDLAKFATRLAEYIEHSNRQLGMSLFSPYIHVAESRIFLLIS